MTMKDETGQGEARFFRTGDCAEIRDVLPLHTAERLEQARMAEVERHLVACPVCAAEAAVVQRIQDVRPEPPETLVDGVLRRIESFVDIERGAGAGPRLTGLRVLPFRPVRRWAAGWGLSAAAVLVLALGIGVIWSADGRFPGDSLLTAFATEEEWESEEWLVAGAPVWDALSDDVLLTLLEDYD